MQISANLGALLLATRHYTTSFMKPTYLLGTILLGLAYSTSALAQTATPVKDGATTPSTIPQLPPAAIPGQPGGTPASVAGPGGTSRSALSPQYPNGVPLRDTDAGNSRSAQPRSGQAMPGAQPTKSIFKGRKRRDS